MKDKSNEHPPKRLVIITGKGTEAEKRTITDIMMYWASGRYVTIPED